jgi:TRAP-type mannitol/chloroaromatic compound transport system permease large subunit
MRDDLVWRHHAAEPANLVPTPPFGFALFYLRSGRQKDYKGPRDGPGSSLANTTNEIYRAPSPSFACN